MRRISALLWITILIFGLHVSCNQSKLKIPDGILNPSELVPLLIDIHIADGFLHQQRFNRQAKEDSAYNYYSSILKKHGITRPIFDSTIFFYTQNPEDFSKIYDEVLEILSKMEGERQELFNAETDDQE